MNKWIWMMDWRRSRGLPPASKEAWKAEEDAWKAHALRCGAFVKE